MGNIFGLIVIGHFQLILSKQINRYKLNNSAMEVDVHGCINQVTSTFCYVRGMICVGTSCVCHGKIIHGKCIHRDNCENNICPEETSYCINYLTFYECICNYGFIKSTSEEICIDEDECLTGRNICTEIEDCINTIGSYECVCKAGYTRDENEEKCIDIDECERTDVCGKNAKCVNTEGSYKCVCMVGYDNHLNDTGPCVDIDECSLSMHQCNETTTTCINTVGSYVCRCRDHLRPSTDTNCVVIAPPPHSICDAGYNECDSNTTECKDDGETYRCLCLAGFKRARPEHSTKCIDIDECQESTNECDRNTTNCINNSGSYYCECRPNLYRISPRKCSGPTKVPNNTEMVFPEFLRREDNLTKWAIYTALFVAWVLVLLCAVCTLATRRRSKVPIISYKTINKKPRDKIRMKSIKKRKHRKAEKIKSSSRT